MAARKEKSAPIVPQPVTAQPAAVRPPPTKVVTVRDAVQLVEAGANVAPLARRQKFGEEFFFYELVKPDNTSMLIGAGSIRALQHRGLCREVVLSA